MKVIIAPLIALLFVSISSISQAQNATFADVQANKIKGSVYSYTAESGERFAVGDTITLGFPNRNEAFDVIVQDAGLSFYPVTSSASGSQVVIKAIKVRTKLVYVKTTSPAGLVYGLAIQNFEVALANGEVKRKQMTSDEALSELKKAKDKLDLEVITQEEYNKIKDKLVPFIH